MNKLKKRMAIRGFGNTFKKKQFQISLNVHFIGRTDVCKGQVRVGLFFALYHDCEMPCVRNIISPSWPVGAGKPFPAAL